MAREKIVFAIAGFDRHFNRTDSGLVVARVRKAVELDRLLDEALEDTFPASDPISNLRGSFPADD
jgi:hypothetical protein